MSRFTAERSSTRSTTDSPNCVGKRRNAQIDLLARRWEIDAPVLRQPALGNVQVRHDLDARNHRQRQVLGRRRHFVKRAVHAITNLEFVFERLEVNVARAILHRLKKHEVHEPHDGRFVGQIGQSGGVLRRCRVVRLARHVVVVAQLLQGSSETLSPSSRIILVDQLRRSGSGRRPPPGLPCATTKPSSSMIAGFSGSPNATCSVEP